MQEEARQAGVRLEGELASDIKEDLEGEFAAGIKEELEEELASVNEVELSASRSGRSRQRAMKPWRRIRTPDPFNGSPFLPRFGTYRPKFVFHTTM